ncbi:hypothetical protein HO173_006469 [Letharia columbiana]|uniref:Uncharacterized protein n=1 Tax=Letharia columbiana TaxID=112416 RepID=A0A8H6L4G9_9LECA|nr:uncharacterized protein HO173_006469 [Letharia columbiana]KAF6235275.1 hypothetical protein HO173_006469 [Letharia columbiana]
MADGALGCDSSYAQLPVHCDAAYYEKWNRERQEAVARNEDPNAKFLTLVAQREANSASGQLRRLFKKGSKTYGQGLTAGEETKTWEDSMKKGVGKRSGGGKGDEVVR